MAETDDIKFMRRCIELASKAEGLTYPNPMVGSVIVHKGKIIGEGIHLEAGKPHAEVNAIHSVKDKSLLRHSALYVILEPCSHFGKTPPCAELIISSEIPRVVIGAIDTSEKVSGGGILRLKDAGCDVVTGILEAECRMLNKRFFTYHEKKRPYIILKWAQSADGFLDIIRSDDKQIKPTWITGKPERILVHKWRASEQAILVGAGTIKSDDPMLNVREWAGPDPLRIILSGTGSINKKFAINDSGNRFLVFTNNRELDIENATMIRLDADSPSSFQIADHLFNAGIQSLFIEGGAKVLNHFIDSGLWDEARIFKGQRCFNKGIKAPIIQATHLSRALYSGSTLEIYHNNLTWNFSND